MTIAEIQAAVKTMYRSASLSQRLLCWGRPYICPFHRLVEYVPRGASILDIGCGSGLFVNLLAYENIISSAIGVDAASNPVATARDALKLACTTADVSFEHRPVEAGLPDRSFDVVSMIDVVHHIDPVYQRAALEAAAKRVSGNGIILFKDISPRPLWRAWANRLHDLILAREWIHYVRDDDVETWMKRMEFSLVQKETINMWWYGHVLMIFRRGGGEHEVEPTENQVSKASDLPVSTIAMSS